METKPAALMGRLANGNEADRGRLVHLVPIETNHYGHGRALCGAKPGRRSGGWDVVNPVSPTCLRCISRQQKSDLAA